MTEGSVVPTWRASRLLQSGAGPLLVEAPALLAGGDARRDPLLSLAMVFPQSGAEPLHGDPSVSVLAPLVARGDDDARRDVRKADPALRRVLMLSPGSPRSKGIDPALGEQGIIVSGDLRHRRDGASGWVCMDRGTNGMRPRRPTPRAGCGSGQGRGPAATHSALDGTWAACHGREGWVGERPSPSHANPPTEGASR